MVQRRFPMAAALLALLLALLPACATTGGAEVGAGGSVDVESEGRAGAARVVVNNNLVVSSSLSVSIVPDVGVRRLLGNVPPGRTVTLNYDGATTGRYRLVGRSTGGRDLVSDPFSFPGGGGQVTWDIQSNIIRVTGP